MKWQFIFFLIFLILISFQAFATIGKPSSNVSSQNYTNGNGIIITGNVISATAVNGTGTNNAMNNQTILNNMTQWFANISQVPSSFPNSNATLWGMFANKTQIMDNLTIMNYIDANMDKHLPNNQTIANAIDNTTIARLNQIMTNATILNYIQSNYLTYYSSNLSILNYIDANMDKHLPNNATIFNVLIGNITAVNNSQNTNSTLWGMFANLTQIMDNLTILNYVTANYITYYPSNISIANAVINSSIARQNMLMNNQTIYSVVDSNISAVNKSQNTNSTLWSMFANKTQIMDNLTILNYIDANMDKHLPNNQTILNVANATGFIRNWSNEIIVSAGGNSNATLWGMFANITQIQNNQTILNLIDNSTIIRQSDINYIKRDYEGIHFYIE